MAEMVRLNTELTDAINDNNQAAITAAIAAIKAKQATNNQELGEQVTLLETNAKNNRNARIQLNELVKESENLI